MPAKEQIRGATPNRQQSPPAVADAPVWRRTIGGMVTTDIATTDDRTLGTGAVMQRPTLSRLGAYAVTIGAFLFSGGMAFAGVGQPEPWQLGLQDAATPVAVDIAWFHDFLLWLVTGIALFVLALLLIVMVRFNARANPTPSRTTHNPLLEVVWTIVPVIILVAIAIPSFRLLFLELDAPKADLTVKATGKQWYWSYNYPDNGNFEFDSLLVEEKDLKPGQPRLLTVDNELVVPVNKVVHVLVTGADVIHSFAVPSFGIKIDAVPGRLNDTWFKATSTGLFHGQCSELCGKDHAFMPITVRVVTDAEFDSWVAAEKKNAGLDQPPATIAAAAGTPSR
jgi:cytochrome c oxidase subunit II